MKHYLVYEARKYSVYADSPQEALEAVRNYPHETPNTDVALETASLNCPTGGEHL